MMVGPKTVDNKEEQERIFFSSKFHSFFLLKDRKRGCGFDNPFLPKSLWNIFSLKNRATLIIFFKNRKKIVLSLLNAHLVV